MSIFYLTHITPPSKSSVCSATAATPTPLTVTHSTCDWDDDAFFGRFKDAFYDRLLPSFLPILLSKATTEPTHWLPHLRWRGMSVRFSQATKLDCGSKSPLHHHRWRWRSLSAGAGVAHISVKSECSRKHPLQGSPLSVTLC